MTEFDPVEFALDSGVSRHALHISEWTLKHERHFSAESKGSELEISVLDIIGSGMFFEGVTAKSVKRALDESPDAKSIRVLLDSPGGSAFDGLAIQSLLKRSKASVEVEILGEASSAASIIAMAGDKIVMHEGAMMMIHRPAAGMWGFAEGLRHLADMLDKLNDGALDVYASRTGLSREDIAALVDAETWMTAREAVERGFADEVIAAKTKPDQYKPKKRKESQSSEPGNIEALRQLALSGDPKQAAFAISALDDESLRSLVDSANKDVSLAARQQLQQRPKNGLAAFHKTPVRRVADFTNRA